VSRIFISHSGSNAASAIAVRDWMRAHGWEDVFLDLDPQRGLVAGDRWQAALSKAVEQCELVVFLISPEWAASAWCKAEFLLTKLGSRPKAILPVIVRPTSFSSLPVEITAEYQIVDLTSGSTLVSLNVTVPGTSQTETVTFTEEGLQRLKIGLERSGIDASYFEWPPANDPNRPPYRGLLPLEAPDAGIFFGRDAMIIAALDLLRQQSETNPPRMVVILGGSGAGKSSFVRAGLLPRVARDNRHFITLPIVRPNRAVLWSETGLLRSLETALASAGVPVSRAEVRKVIESGAGAIQALLRRVTDRSTPMSDTGERLKAPMLVLTVDQAEELFVAEGQREASLFLGFLRKLLPGDDPAIATIFTIRSDNYERLQLAQELEGVRQVTFSLPPMPKGGFAEVIKGPSRRLEGTNRRFSIDEALVEKLLSDIEAGGSKDALPLLAFTMERLYDEYGASGYLRADYYETLGGISGSIAASVEQAFKTADANTSIPRDHKARLALLRRGLIPWLAGIDLQTGAPRRRVARLSEIPAEARPLMDLLVDQRLLSTDVSIATEEKTVEPAHDALLRQWGLLNGWLLEDRGLLSVLEGIKSASRDWAANAESPTWLTHRQDRLRAADVLLQRADLAANLEATDRRYLAECATAEKRQADKEAEDVRFRRRMNSVVMTLLLGVIVALVCWINQDAIMREVRWYLIERPYRLANFDFFVLTRIAERDLKPGSIFRECKEKCPEMMVVPAGWFEMGSDEKRRDNEGPRHRVTIAKPFAVGEFMVTYDEWDACVSYGACVYSPFVSDASWGRGRRPVLYVTYDDVQRYIDWLSRMTGKRYRLLSEAEFEYAARAGSQAAYPWGDEVGSMNANCNGCGDPLGGKMTTPVDQFPPNAFGLHDMVGNLWERVEDCYNPHYEVQGPNGKASAPNDGSAWLQGDCRFNVVRGGSWYVGPDMLRVSARDMSIKDEKDYNLGFRVARSLDVQ
jgi:formylglycine-generating enzyme required for sulfatase activity